MYFIAVFCIGVGQPGSAEQYGGKDRPDPMDVVGAVVSRPCEPEERDEETDSGDLA